jgi:hypothetical protein
MNRVRDEPPQLLVPENQRTEPWGGSEHGSPCDKCERRGSTDHRCWSCLLTSPSPECPACAGRVRWQDVCPVCRGSGVVDGAPRHGISTFPRLEGLYHYMLANGADLEDCVIVELEAARADDLDFDADEGAVLVIPTAIAQCLSVDEELAVTVRERATQLA